MERRINNCCYTYQIRQSIKVGVPLIAELTIQSVVTITNMIKAKQVQSKLGTLLTHTEHRSWFRGKQYITGLSKVLGTFCILCSSVTTSLEDEQDISMGIKTGQSLCIPELL
jgi:hypothetical protein